MALNIGSAITNGLRRVGNRNGMVLIVIAALLGLTWQVAITSFFAQLFSPEITDSVGLAVEAPIAVLGTLGLVLFFLLSYLTIVAMRTFVAGEANQIPSEFLRRRIPWVVVNLIVGGIVYSILAFIGALFLLIPGLIVYTALLFMSIYIAVEDENFISAMADSWHLTRGNWLRLFLLLVIITVPIMILFMIVSTGVTIAFGPNSTVSQLISGLISMPFSILLLGILSEAFVQLRSDPSPESPGGMSNVDPTGDPTTS